MPGKCLLVNNFKFMLKNLERVKSIVLFATFIQKLIHDCDFSFSFVIDRRTEILGPARTTGPSTTWLSIHSSLVFLSSGPEKKGQAQRLVTNSLLNMNGSGNYRSLSFINDKSLSFALN
jgi:hypothetical protein